MVMLIIDVLRVGASATGWGAFWNWSGPNSKPETPVCRSPDGGRFKWMRVRTPLAQARPLVGPEGGRVVEEHAEGEETTSPPLGRRPTRRRSCPALHRIAGPVVAVGGVAPLLQRERGRPAACRSALHECQRAGALDGSGRGVADVVKVAPSSSRNDAFLVLNVRDT
jgi:hypothetical protein